MVKARAGGFEPSKREKIFSLVMNGNIPGNEKENVFTFSISLRIWKKKVEKRMENLFVVKIRKSERLLVNSYDIYTNSVFLLRSFEFKTLK